MSLYFKPIQGGWCGKGLRCDLIFWTRCGLCSCVSQERKRWWSAKVPWVLEEPFVWEHIEKFKLWVVNIYWLHLHYGPVHHLMCREINAALVSEFECRYTLGIAVNCLTAANISVYNLQGSNLIWTSTKVSMTLGVLAWEQCRLCV